MQRRLAQITLLAIFALGIAVSPTFAHTELISTVPKANSTISEAPERLSLTFSEAPLVAGSRIEIQQPQGKTIATLSPVLYGTTLSAPWPTAIQPGTVAVFWRAVSDDGHVVSSGFRFNFESASTPTNSPAPAPQENSRRLRELGAIGFVVLILMGLGAITMTNRKRFR